MGAGPGRRDVLRLAAGGAVASAILLPGQGSAQAQAPEASGALPSGVQAAGPSNEHTEFVLSAAADPLDLIAQWLAEEKAAGGSATEMTLATVDAQGMPDARMMLLKEVRDGSFLFTSFTRSIKGHELAANPRAALLFYLKKLGRQARVRGRVRRLTDAEADAAWQKRGPRPLKLRDWAWPQSDVIQSAEELERKLAEMELRFPGEVPRPDWTGYLVTPLSIEFFLPHPKTGLHERIRFSRKATGQAWRSDRLAP